MLKTIMSGNSYAGYVSWLHALRWFVMVLGKTNFLFNISSRVMANRVEA